MSKIIAQKIVEKYEHRARGLYYDLDTQIKQALKDWFYGDCKQMCIEFHKKPLESQNGDAKEVSDEKLHS